MDKDAQLHAPGDPSSSLRPDDHFAELIDSLDVIVWQADPATLRFTFVSKRAEELLGYPASRWIEEPGFWAAHIHPADREMAEVTCRAATDRLEDHEFEYRMIASDGSTVWLNDIIRVETENGVAVRLNGVMVDICRQKAAEQQLRESVERFTLAARATGDAVYDWDISTGSVWWNEATAQLFDEPNPTYAWWSSSVHPADWPRVEESIVAAQLSADDVWTASYRFRRGNGSYAHIFDRGYFVRDQDGHALRLIGVMTDLSERLSTDEALRQSETKFRLIAQSALDAVVSTAQSGEIVYWNDGAQRIFGYSEQEALIGMHVNRIIRYGNSDAEGTEDPLVRTYVTGRAVEVLGLRKDGSSFPAEISVATWKAGATSYFTTIVRDITERKLAESEKQMLQNQLEQESRLGSLGRLAATVAHEFNNVLMGIQPFAEIIDRRAGDQPILRSAATNIQKAVQRGSRITQEILRFARPAELSRQPFDLAEWLQSVVDVAARMLPAETTIRTLLPQGSISSTGDENQLHQVMINLIINARDSMPRGGVIQISAQQALSGLTRPFGYVPTADRFIHLSVQDSGSGIAPDVLPHIFEPMFTTKKSGGTGLGLAVSHQVLTAHGGHIFVESALGEGTTFHLFLPASDAPFESPE